MPFLNDLVRRPLADQPGLIGEALLIGQGQLALEVAVYRSSAKPTSTALQAAWRGRRAGRAAPVLVVATFEGSAWIAGPDGEDLPIYTAIDIGTAERLCQAALEQPDRHAALLFLSQAMPSLETRSPGLRNQGLFALHELTEDVPRRPDWLEHTRRSQSILAARPQGRDLLQRLGYPDRDHGRSSHQRITRAALAGYRPSRWPDHGLPTFGWFCLNRFPEVPGGTQDGADPARGSFGTQAMETSQSDSAEDLAFRAAWEHRNFIATCFAACSLHSRNGQG